MTTAAATAQIVATLRETGDNATKAAGLLGMSRTRFRRHRDANADEIAAILAQPAETAVVDATEGYHAAAEQIAEATAALAP